MRTYFFILCFCTTACFAGDIKYPVSAIPEVLKKDANMVKRMEDVQLEIISTKEATLHYKYAITVLNENGDDYAEFSEWYDKLQHIASLEGNLYDAAGNLLKKAKSKDFADKSAVSDINLIDDNRLKSHSFYYKAYPYTVEYEVNIKLDQTFSLTGWLPQDYKQLSVEKSMFTVIVPQDYVLRYKAFNYKQAPAESVEKNRKRYVWQVDQLAAIKKFYAAPEWRELTPSVKLAPSAFEIEGYKGNMSTWQDFGKFIYTLTKSRDQLPVNIKNKVAEISASSTSDLDKVQKLYSFLQQNTRYISIQLGIGGWQPFDAAYVAQKGYGDCKALSNYMYSLLKEAGIKSYYALIKSGSSDINIIEDFPSNQFNHAIICVPLQKDTLWLECTSQSVPAGYMGEFTGNRKALLVDENGGQLVSTPRYKVNENLLLRTIKAKVDPEGTLSFVTDAKYKGTQQDDLSMFINAVSKDKVHKELQENLELATYNVNGFDYKETKSVMPELNEHLDITVNNYASVSGKRLFINPNILNRSNFKLTPEDDRPFDFVFNNEYKDDDEVEIEIPEGYSIESMTPEVNIKTGYATYNSSIKVLGNKLMYHRVMVQLQSRQPAKEEAGVVKFYDDVYRADHSRVVLVKKES
jgi:hypothetical protein